MSFQVIGVNTVDISPCCMPEHAYSIYRNIRNTHQS